MPWRLYDTLNDQWYDDDLYPTQDACITAGNVYMHEAHILDDDLQLTAEVIDPSEPFISVMEEDNPVP